MTQGKASSGTKGRTQVLILGANGRFGHHTAKAFARAGWNVLAQTRKKSSLKEDLALLPQIHHHACDLEDIDALIPITKTCSVIVNALNPPYATWLKDIPQITKATLRLAKASGAAVILPGNVYNFGAAMPEILDETTPHSPSNLWGQCRVDAESAYRNASRDGVQTLVLRIGDFLQREPSGNWFDTHLTAKLDKGVCFYPGPTNLPHAYGYLPDAARAVVGLAEKRHTLSPFEDIPFPGHTLSGKDMRHKIEKVLNRQIKLKPIPWPLIKIMSLFNKDMRGVLAMRYLWNTAHRLDDQKFNAILPNFQPTSLEKMFRQLVG